MYQGDCLEIMKDIPDNSIDIILTDPPYNTTNNEFEYILDYDSIWNLYKKVLKENGVVIITSQGLFTALTILSNKEWFKYKIVWEKSKATNFLNCKKQPLRKHEDIIVFYNNTPIYNPQMSLGLPYNKGVRGGKTGSYNSFKPALIKNESGLRYPFDIIKFNSPKSSKNIEQFHPTQKPIDLFEYLIETYTNEDMLILDTFIGSGTTAIAAQNTNRKFIGIEKDQNYFNIACKRIKENEDRLKNNNILESLF